MGASRIIKLRAVPAATLLDLTGFVAPGGNAAADLEALIRQSRRRLRESVRQQYGHGLLAEKAEGVDMV